MIETTHLFSERNYPRVICDLVNGFGLASFEVIMRMENVSLDLLVSSFMMMLVRFISLFECLKYPYTQFFFGVLRKTHSLKF